jgi:DNA repair exonuclease SbcCD ATPase subunit
MKKAIFTAIAVSVTMLYSCSSPTQKIEKAKENVEAAEADLQQARMDSISDAQFNQESANIMADYDRQLAEAKAQMERSKSKLKAQDQKRIEELEERNTSLKKKLAEYQKAGKEDWNNFKTEFKHDMNELGGAIKDIGTNNTQTK